MPAARRPLPPSGLRVAVVAESFLPSVNGVARSVERVVDHLASRGHEALIAAPGPGADHHGHVPVVRLPSVPLPLCPDFPLGLPTPRLRDALERFAPDVIHLASPACLGAAGVALAEELGIPSVAVFQTDLAGFALQYRCTPLAAPAWRWLRRIHGRATRTLAPSRATVVELRRHDIPEVHRWGRGIDTDALSPVHRSRPPTAEVERVRVGYVGRLAAEKGVQRLEHALRVPGIEVVVVGAGPKRRALERSLPGAHFTGHLQGPALSRAFADLDVFVHTGTHETFCQAAQEALASGVPVVAPAAGGLLDLVEHERNGLLWRPDMPCAIAPALERLVRRPQWRAQLGREARRGVLPRTWDTLGDELLGHYGAAIAQARAPRVGRVA